jgi:SAM-dependent methyltransferase
MMMAYTNDPRVNTGLDFYFDQDPYTAAYPPILDFLKARSGRKVLDFGCGVGAYSYHLQRAGFEVGAVERNPKYVEIARSIGVRAELLTGETLPFEDDSFDTVIMVEVLEHLPDSSIPAVLSEVRRVARRNVLLTVPDCSEFPELIKHQFMHGHFIAVDHVQFFTAENLPSLLRQFFPHVSARQGDPLFPHLLLPKAVRKPVSLLYRLGWLRPTIYSRLYAEAAK